MTHVLIVEDEHKIKANLVFQLREEGFETTAVGSAEDALRLLDDGAKTRPELLLCDVRLPGLSGIELVRRLVEEKRLPPTVIVSGEASISETVEALKLGVRDFIEKPFSKERLLQSIRNTLEHAALRREVADLRSELRAESEILGTSPAMEKLRELIHRAAPTEARVLIRGESGTGKELVANALHQHSPRAERPFIKLNCAAIPSHLIEDELFGHVKGAFTDARSAKPGLFEEADGGTLFLDEIGDMDYQLQSRLLRVLEDGRVRRIGENRDREVDVRVIAATHCDLEQSVREEKFREDLYFRLAHLPIEVPPLRQRGADVRRLFDHFVELFTRRHRRPPRQVDDDLYPHLERHGWPGNVRELKNVCERLVVFGGDPLTADELPSSFFGDGSVRTGSAAVRLDSSLPIVPLRDFKALCEKEYVERVLRRTNWNFAAAARLLEIQRTYLHQKAASLGIRRPQAEPEPVEA
jgi:two-component system, NtrC family, nitrogen regulation response regulator NtrX